MEHRPKPDNRADNVEKLQEMVQHTIENMEEAEETMQFASDEERKNIESKNQRRRESIEAMRNEIHDEARNMEDTK